MRRGRNPNFWDGFFFGVLPSAARADAAEQRKYGHEIDMADNKSRAESAAAAAKQAHEWNEAVLRSWTSIWVAEILAQNRFEIATFDTDDKYLDDYNKAMKDMGTGYENIALGLQALGGKLTQQDIKNLRVRGVDGEDAQAIGEQLIQKGKGQIKAAAGTVDGAKSKMSPGTVQKIDEAEARVESEFEAQQPPPPREDKAPWMSSPLFNDKEREAINKDLSKRAMKVLPPDATDADMDAKMLEIYRAEGGSIGWLFKKPYGGSGKSGVQNKPSSAPSGGSGVRRGRGRGAGESKPKETSLNGGGSAGVSDEGLRTALLEAGIEPTPERIAASKAHIAALGEDSFWEVIGRRGKQVARHKDFDYA